MPLLLVVSAGAIRRCGQYFMSLPPFALATKVISSTFCQYIQPFATILGSLGSLKSKIYMVTTCNVHNLTKNGLILAKNAV